MKDMSGSPPGPVGATMKSNTGCGQNKRPREGPFAQDELRAVHSWSGWSSSTVLKMLFTVYSVTIQTARCPCTFIQTPA